MMYQLALEEKWKKRGEESLKRCIGDQIKEINTQKREIISIDMILSDDLFKETEDFSLLHMANSLKDVIKQNTEKLCKLQEEEAALRRPNMEIYALLKCLINNMPFLLGHVCT